MFLYTIYDKVAKKYTAPSHFINEAVAVRSFKDLMCSAGYSSSKGDYELYCIGSFDTDNGIIVANAELSLIVKGSDFVSDN